MVGNFLSPFCAGSLRVTGNEVSLSWLQWIVDEALGKRFEDAVKQFLEGAKFCNGFLLLFSAIELAVEIGEEKDTLFAFLSVADDAVASAGLVATALDKLLLLLETVDLSLTYLASMSSKKSSSLTIHPSSTSTLAALLTLLMLAAGDAKEIALTKELT